MYEKKIASYKAPLVGWIFMAIWLAFLAMFTWLFVRDGGFHQFSPTVEIGMMLLFWLFGAAGSSYLFAMPVVTLAMNGDQFITREYWLLKSRESRFPVALSRPVIKKTKDSEGDDYYRIHVTAPGGREITIGGYNDRTDAEAFIAAMDQIIEHR